MEKDLATLPLEELVRLSGTGRIAPFRELRRRAREGRSDERLAAIRALPALALVQPVLAALEEIENHADAATAKA
ncbi:MAG: hypothetical protein ACREIU_12875, partial [Planctomycetota bacterium]